MKTAEQHAVEIARAIVLCAQRDDGIQAMLERAKGDGFALSITGVDLNAVPLKGKGRSTQLTVSDKRFLRSLRIALGETDMEASSGS